jgi:transposase
MHVGSLICIKAATKYQRLAAGSLLRNGGRLVGGRIVVIGSSLSGIGRPPGGLSRAYPYLPPRRAAWSLHVIIEELNGTGIGIGSGTIVLLHLPPYAPELNPTENVWDYLRGNKLSAGVWDSYDAIVEDYRNARSWLIDDPERIRSHSAPEIG